MFWVCIAVAAFAVWFFSDVFNRWLSRKMADRMLKKITDPHYKPAPRPPAPLFIEITDAGFEFHCRETPGQTLAMEWSGIAKVSVFKRDLFGYDLVCMAVEAHDGAVIELNEEMDGWMPLIEILPDKLPSCTPWHDWFIRVAFPAFAPNLETIFERAPPPVAVPIASRP